MFEIDLPPPILTSERGSFAHETLKTRVPGILQQTMASNSFPPDIAGALQALYDEVVGGTVRGLQEDAPDREFWDDAACPFLGRTWREVPWYWAEAYFYRRILEATGYFQAGPWQGFDPFAVQKAQEWQPDAAPPGVERLLAGLPSHPEARFQAILQASLWGNRTDLSYAPSLMAARNEQGKDQRSNLLADDSAQVWELMDGGRQGDQWGRPSPLRHVVLIADNAGTELLMDLVLADHLLSSNLATEIDLHLKPQPFFVSDAMFRDVADGLQALPAGGELAESLARRLWAHLDSGRLRLATHWFYASSLLYRQMPFDLRRRLAESDLVLVKGDANYRRLLDDAHWAPTTPFQQALGYFPAPLVALRTLKAELVVGLRPGQAEKAQAEDPTWLVNGKRGLIQARLDR